MRNACNNPIVIRTVNKVSRFLRATSQILFMQKDLFVSSSLMNPNPFSFSWTHQILHSLSSHFFLQKGHLFYSLISHNPISFFWILSALPLCAHSLQILWHLDHASLLQLLRSVNSSTTMSTLEFTPPMGPPSWSLLRHQTLCCWQVNNNNATTSTNKLITPRPKSRRDKVNEGLPCCNIHYITICWGLWGLAPTGIPRYLKGISLIVQCKKHSDSYTN